MLCGNGIRLVSVLLRLRGWQQEESSQIDVYHLCLFSFVTSRTSILLFFTAVILLLVSYRDNLVTANSSDVPVTS